MHSERILIFEPETSKLRKAGVGAYGNIMVGIKRRYNNVLVDTDKQQQIEMFLGMKHSVYFPSTFLAYKVLATASQLCNQRSLIYLGLGKPPGL